MSTMPSTRTFRVLICGGRSYDDMEAVAFNLGRLKPTQIAHGGAHGADALAHAWAVKNGIESITYSADWKALGKKAGPMRNQVMIDDFRPHIVIAFPGGSGTADCIRRAKRANCTVITVGGGAA